jgi:arylsulfatase A-like enzyme
LIGRRSFLVSPLVLLAAPRKPNVVLMTAERWRGKSAPWSAGATADVSNDAPNLKKFGDESLVFTRTYAACPESQQARKAMLTGKFPHAAQKDDATLASILKSEGCSFTELKFAADREFGELLKTIEPAKQTIVVLASDRGLDAGNSTDEALRMMFAIRYPASLKPGARDLASQTDILPTVLALCGIEIPEEVQGRNLLASDAVESVFAEGDLGQKSSWRAVVRGYDKLVATSSDEVTHLFNLADDPEEASDMARDPQQKLRRDSMLALLKVWRKKLGDGVDPSGLRKR